MRAILALVSRTASGPWARKSRSTLCRRTPRESNSWCGSSAGTLVVGFVLGWVCCRTPTRTSAANEGALVAWERLTNKAIRFVNKRHKVGLAFNGYKRYSLRNTEGSRPTGARTSRRRSTTPGAPLLHEGPALTDGPHRRRAPGNQQFG